MQSRISNEMNRQHRNFYVKLGSLNYFPKSTQQVQERVHDSHFFQEGKTDTNTHNSIMKLYFTPLYIAFAMIPLVLGTELNKSPTKEPTKEPTFEHSGGSKSKSVKGTTVSPSASSTTPELANEPNHGKYEFQINFCVDYYSQGLTILVYELHRAHSRAHTRTHA